MPFITNLKGIRQLLYGESLIYACQKVSDQPGCVQKDDFKEIIEKIIDSEIVVYASPVYVWDFSAQLKALIGLQVDKYLSGIIEVKNKESLIF